MRTAGGFGRHIPHRSLWGGTSPGHALEAANQIRKPVSATPKPHQSLAPTRHGRINLFPLHVSTGLVLRASDWIAPTYGRATLDPSFFAREQPMASRRRHG